MKVLRIYEQTLSFLNSELKKQIIEKEENLTRFYMSNVNNKDYVLVLENQAKRTDKDNIYNIEGHVFKIMNLDDMKNLGNFYFVGKSFFDSALGANISFEQNVENLALESQTAYGFVCKCKFKGFIKDNEQIGNKLLATQAEILLKEAENKEENINVSMENG